MHCNIASSKLDDVEDIGRLDVAELMNVWEAYGTLSTWTDAAERGADPDIAAGALAEVPEVTALDALEANRRLVDLVTGRRWYVMREAREAGASWSEIGEALGMTKQGAQDWYRRKLVEQEKYVGDLHDTAAARAVLAPEES